MPIVFINGIPQPCNFDVKELKQNVRNIISQIPALKTVPEKVTVYTPFDICPDENKIIVLIFLFEEKDRTDAVIKEMSSTLKRFLRANYFPGMKVGVDPVFTREELCSPSTDD